MIKEDRYGMLLDTPEGLTAKRFQAGYMFGAPTVKGLLLLLFHRNASLEELRTDIYAGFFDESGFNIQVDGQVLDINDEMVMAHYKGTADNKPSKGFSIGMLSPFGGGVLIASIATADDFGDVNMDMVEDLARVITWYEPTLKSGVEEWTAYLQQKVFTAAHTDTKGMTHLQFDDQDAFSCQFTADDPAVAFASFAAGGANLGGQWEVISSMDEYYLRLIFFNAEEQQFRLRLMDDHLLLDDQVWHIQ